MSQLLWVGANSRFVILVGWLWLRVTQTLLTMSSQAGLFFGIQRTSGHIFRDLVLVHLNQRVTLKQYADAVRALYDIDPSLLPEHAQPVPSRSHVSCGGSLLDVFQKAANDPISWASTSVLGFIERATIDDWKLLQSTGQPLFTDFAQCLKKLCCGSWASRSSLCLGVALPELQKSS